MEGTDYDKYLDNLLLRSKQLISLLEVYKFLEELEALTKDKVTSDKIREFLIKEGIWKI